MIDVALSIMALIAGGLTLELFAAPRPLLSYQEKTLEATEEFQTGNPS
ncbi:MAG TPA: hypothetical protein VL361_20960 [Candidatus Limnocylindrales bacterium]|jgi:hypothetical protein|nr:hypothetical protein [Candidatus Limnocylindrales bacterium]